MVIELNSSKRDDMGHGSNVTDTWSKQTWRQGQWPLDPM